MAKYIVQGDVTLNYSIEIEANSEVEAQALAEEVHTDKWELDGRSYLDVWNVEQIVEVK